MVLQNIYTAWVFCSPYFSLSIALVFFWSTSPLDFFNGSNWDRFTLTAFNAPLSWAFSTSVHRPSPPRRSEEELNNVCGWRRGERDIVRSLFCHFSSSFHNHLSFIWSLRSWPKHTPYCKRDGDREREKLIERYTKTTFTILIKKRHSGTKCSVSCDHSEIISICRFCAQDTSLIINDKNSCAVDFNFLIYISFVQFEKSFVPLRWWSRS